MSDGNQHSPEAGKDTGDSPPASDNKTPRPVPAPEIWVVGLIGVVLILLVLFGTVL